MIDIQIQVKKIDSQKHIVEKHKGIDELIVLIHTGEIEKALGKVTDTKDVLRLTNRPYVEDWKLRKRILEFLKENQKHGIEPKFVNEPKNYFRRLDENSGIDDFEVNGLYTLETDNGIGIVWENLDFTEDRATYIFKCSEQHYEKQLNWLIDGIKGMAQFRSALLSKMDDPMLPSFKRKYGFVGSIRKRRGRSSSFSNWKLKLKKALALNPPLIPSNEELLKLEELDFQVPHHTMVRIKKERKVGQINPKSLPIKDPDYDVGAKEEIKSSVSGNKIKLLSALKEFNKKFLDEFYPS